MLARLQNLQAGFVSFGRQANGIGHASVRLQANRLAMRRRVDDALREAGVERLRQVRPLVRIGQVRSQSARRHPARSR